MTPEQWADKLSDECESANIKHQKQADTERLDFEVRRINRDKMMRDWHAKQAK